MFFIPSMRRRREEEGEEEGEEEDVGGSRGEKERGGEEGREEEGGEVCVVIVQRRGSATLGCWKESDGHGANYLPNFLLYTHWKGRKDGFTRYSGLQGRKYTGHKWFFLFWDTF